MIEGAPAPFFPINRERPRGKKKGNERRRERRGERTNREEGGGNGQKRGEETKKNREKTEGKKRAERREKNKTETEENRAEEKHREEEEERSTTVQATPQAAADSTSTKPLQRGKNIVDRGNKRNKEKKQRITEGKRRTVTSLAGLFLSTV